MMCLGVVLFGSNLFGTVCTSWTYMSISLAKLGKFSLIIFSNNFSIFCSFSSGTPMIWMLVHLEMFQRLLILFSFFKFFFSSCFSDWMLISFYVPNHWFEPHLPSLHCWFPVDFSLFHLVLSSFLPLCFCHTQIFKHPYHQCFKLCLRGCYLRFA